MPHLTMGYLLRKAGTTQEKEICCSQQSWKQLRELKSMLTSDTEIESVEFAQLIFGLAFVRFSSLYSFPYILEC